MSNVPEQALSRLRQAKFKAEIAQRELEELTKLAVEMLGLDSSAELTIDLSTGAVVDMSKLPTIDFNGRT